MTGVFVRGKILQLKGKKKGGTREEKNQAE